MAHSRPQGQDSASGLQADGLPTPREKSSDQGICKRMKRDGFDCIRNSAQSRPFSLLWIYWPSSMSFSPTQFLPLSLVPWASSTDILQLRYHSPFNPTLIILNFFAPHSFHHTYCWYYHPRSHFDSKAAGEAYGATLTPASTIPAPALSTPFHWRLKQQERHNLSPYVYFSQLSTVKPCIGNNLVLWVSCKVS